MAQTSLGARAILENHKVARNVCGDEGSKGLIRIDASQETNMRHHRNVVTRALFDCRPRSSTVSQRRPQRLGRVVGPSIAIPLPAMAPAAFRLADVSIQCDPASDV
jgi:hypothetical protein